MKKGSIKKYTGLWDGIKNEIETINSSRTGKYGKDFMKIKFELDDDLSLNKKSRFSTMAIVVRSIFEDEGKFYPQVYLGECFHEL